MAAGAHSSAPLDPCTETSALSGVSEEMAAAIARRDVDAVASRLAPGFLHRTPGGSTIGRAAFLSALGSLPGRVLFIRLQGIEIEVMGDVALLSGVQHARLEVEGQEMDDRRAFVEYFVKDAGRWLLRAAFDMSGSDVPQAEPGRSAPRAGF